MCALESGLLRLQVVTRPWLKRTKVKVEWRKGDWLRELPPPVHANGKNERACDVKKRDNYNLPLVNRVQDGAVEDNRGIFFFFLSTALVREHMKQKNGMICPKVWRWTAGTRRGK